MSQASTDITHRQNTEEFLTLFRAFTWRYRLANRWTWMRLIVAGLLAGLGLLVSLSVDPHNPWAASIGIFAAVWLGVDQVGLLYLARRSRERAVLAHELYDAELFRLPWNKTLAGAEPDLHDVLVDAAKEPMDDAYLNWYTLPPDAQRPRDSLSCQHQNASWSTRLRRRFTILTGALLGLWVSVGIILAWSDMSVASYVAQILLPSAPGILAVLELIFDHRRGAGAAAAIAEEAADLAKGDEVTVQDLRRLQDGIFRYRVDFHQPPTWYYKARRRRFQVADHDVIMIKSSPVVGGSVLQECDDIRR